MSPRPALILYLGACALFLILAILRDLISAGLDWLAESPTSPYTFAWLLHTLHGNLGTLFTHWVYRPSAASIWGQYYGLYDISLYLPLLFYIRTIYTRHISSTYIPSSCICLYLAFVLWGIDGRMCLYFISYTRGLVFIFPCDFWGSGR